MKRIAGVWMVVMVVSFAYLSFDIWTLGILVLPSSGHAWAGTSS